MKTFDARFVPSKYLDRTAHEEPMRIQRTNSLCTDCERSVRGRCSWRERFEPYPGWVAERNDIKVGPRLEKAESYYVKSCPGFVASHETIRILRERKKGVTEHFYLVRRIKLKPEHLDDEGCTKLFSAVIKSVRVDYVTIKEDRAKLREWIRESPYFADPKAIIEALEKVAKICDADRVKRKNYMRWGSLEPPEYKLDHGRRRYPSPVKRRSGHWLIFNPHTDQEFAECSICGHEHPKPDYPRLCPDCGAFMVEREEHV